MGARATEARRVSLRPRAQNFLHWSVSRADRTCRPYSRTSGDPYPYADRLHQLAANSLVVFGANVSTDQAHATRRAPGAQKFDLCSGRSRPEAAKPQYARGAHGHGHGHARGSATRVRSGPHNLHPAQSSPRAARPTLVGTYGTSGRHPGFTSVALTSSPAGVGRQ